MSVHESTKLTTTRILQRELQKCGEAQIVSKALDTKLGMICGLTLYYKPKPKHRHIPIRGEPRRELLGGLPA